MKTLVTIATYKKAATAYFLKENLENKGIDCFFAFTAISLQDSDEVQIQVKGEDVERAIRIMLDIKDKYGQDIESLESVRHIRKIIVPTDFSRRSEEACYYAVHLAQKLQAEIKIVHVYEKPIGDVYVKETATFETFTMKLLLESEKKAKSEMVALFQRVKDYMTRHDIKGVNIHSSTMMGHIVRSLKGICSEYNPDLLVLGTVGKREKSDSVLAGVAHHIILGLGIPVYAIPGPFNVDEFEKMNILYATDFNEKDHTSLNQLLSIMEPFEKRITCIHIDTANNPVNYEIMDELNEVLKQQYSQHQLACRLIVDEDVYHGIKDFADKYDINLLSFTTRKQGIFKKLFRSSLFKKILQEANLPILIFPS